MLHCYLYWRNGGIASLYSFRRFGVGLKVEPFTLALCGQTPERSCPWTLYVDTLRGHSLNVTVSDASSEASHTWHVMIIYIQVR